MSAATASEGRRRLPWLVALGALVGAGCLEATPSAIPPEPDAPGGTRVLIAEDTAGTLHLRVVQGALDGLSLQAGATWLVDLDVPPGALLLPVDQTLPTWTRADAQALPPPRRILGFDHEGWSETAADDVPLQRATIEPVTFERCLEAGGCLAPDDPPVCNLSCDPAAPRAPEAPRRPCPDGWTSRPTAEGPPLCLPEPVETLDCPRGTRQGFDGEACAALGPCADGPWPTARPAATAVLRVRPGAVGGDGSAAQPFGTLTAALARAGPGADILLAEGTFAAPPRLDTEGLRIAGLCAARSRLDVAATVQVQASATFEALSLDSSTSTTAVVEPDATLTVRAVDADGGRLHARGGDLHIEASRLAAGVPLQVTDAIAEVRETDLRAGDRVIVRGQGELHIEGSRLVGGHIDLGPGTTLDARQLAISHGARGLSGFTPRAITLHDTWIDQTPDTAMVVVGRPSLGPPPQVELRRFATFQHQPTISVRLLGCEVDAEDVFIEVVDDGGALVLQPFDHGAAPGMRFSGLWLEGFNDTLLGISRIREFTPNLEVTVEDLVVLTHPADTQEGITVAVAQDLRLVLHRAYIETYGQAGLSSNCADGEFRDVRVTGRAGRGVILEPSPFAGVDALGTTERVRVAGDFDRALHMAASDSCPQQPVTIRDVDLEGCADCRIGMEVMGLVKLEAERLSVRGFDFGVNVEPPVSLRIRESRVEDNANGFVVPGDIDLTDVLRTVALDNGQDVVRR